MSNNWVNLINSNSYTDEEGIANGVIGVWEQFIDDTITVYSGYTDEYNIHHVDSISVIID